MNSVINQDQALELLSASEVVALPTETVYGLAGRVGSDEALKRIFATKERPFFDPLIMHVTNLEMAENWAEFDDISRLLAKEIWPGPLTLVLPKKENVSDLITNGGPTVALRSPNHEIFQNLIEKLNEPLAAPSANMFGKTSPTCAEHIVDEFSGKVSVVDGGSCVGGIESTVLQVNQETKELTILRPGIVNKEMLSAFLSKNSLDYTVTTKTQTHVPGHLKNHYQPSVPLVLVRDGFTNEEVQPALAKIDSALWSSWTLPNDPTLAARNLYGDLRNFSKKGEPVYLLVDPEWNENPSWQGLLDRLEKASTGSLQKEGTSLVYQPKN